MYLTLSHWYINTGELLVLLFGSPLPWVSAQTEVFCLDKKVSKVPFCVFASMSCFAVIEMLLVHKICSVNTWGCL